MPHDQQSMKSRVLDRETRKRNVAAALEATIETICHPCYQDDCYCMNKRPRGVNAPEVCDLCGVLLKKGKR